MTRPVSRSATRAAPSGRNATAEGVRRPAATVPSTATPSSVTSHNGVPDGLGTGGAVGTVVGGRVGASLPQAASAVTTRRTSVVVRE
jgi:hypothetical protein